MTMFKVILAEYFQTELHSMWVSACRCSSERSSCYMAFHSWSNWYLCL